MENTGIKIKNLTPIFLASVYLAILSLINIVNVLQGLFIPSPLEQIGFFGIIYQLFFLNINNWHMLALASCGIIFMSIFISSIKNNAVNKMILQQNKILLIILLVLSGIKIISLVYINFEAATVFGNNFADIILIEPIKPYQIIIWVFDSIFSFLILVGIILFSIVMLKKFAAGNLKKIALYVSIGGTAGNFITRLIYFSLSLPATYNVYLNQEMYGTTTAQIVIRILRSAVLIFIPVATIVIIHFGLKFAENRLRGLPRGSDPLVGFSTKRTDPCGRFNS